MSNNIAPKKKNDVITKINAKDYWGANVTDSRIEEHFLSPFIARDALKEISAITGFELEVEQMELHIGSMRADIVCKDVETNDIVVIENQLGDSDHDHIGKCFTYLANLGAKSTVWVCESFKDEHIKAIETLNEITPEEYSFYALELVLEKYSNGEVFYSFNKKVAPSRITKIASQIKALSPFAQNTLDFCEKLIDTIKPKIHTAHLNRGRHFHKIWRGKHGQIAGDIYCGFTVSRKTPVVSFEISCQDPSCPPDLISKIDSIVNNLNNKGYHFIHSLGKRNGDINKWLYEIQLSDNMDTDIKKCSIICMDMYSAFVKK